MIKFFNSTRRFSLKRANSRAITDTVLYTSSVLILFFGLSYSAVPLYKLFCQTTGYAGTVKNVADSAAESKKMTALKNSRRLKISFNADISIALPWSFKPQQSQVHVYPGETSLVFYTAKNNSDKDVVGVSTYNVAPMKAGAYFNKIQCFCFEEQRLRAGEEVDMPVFFYIDPSVILRMFIQTETTPNANALKFKPGVPVAPDGKFYEYQNSMSATNSLLARQLFAIKGVKSVFFAPNFITINKMDDQTWVILKPHIFGVIMDYFSVNKHAVIEKTDGNSVSLNEDDSDPEIVLMIKELLDSRIRPSVQEDGGDIEFVGFKDGKLRLKMKGSCRGCSSSEVTLKNGIENMMKHYIPEVLSVEQVLDPLEEISKTEFEKFEKSK